MKEALEWKLRRKTGRLTREWKQLHKGSYKIPYSDQVNRNEMGGTCNTRQKNC